MDGLKHIVIWTIGWLFIGLGILGLFLPFLQGIVFIIIGLAILSSRSQLVKQFLRHLEVRYPHYHKWVETWRKRIRHWFKRD